MVGSDVGEAVPDAVDLLGQHVDGLGRVVGAAMGRVVGEEIGRAHV
jgi:hypothetical protein